MLSESGKSNQPVLNDPDVIYAGTEPSALFRSADRGESFSLIRSLWDHPHREMWQPGGGGQAIHSVLPDPTDPAHVTVAMSTGGVYRTYDRGETVESREHWHQGELRARSIA